MARCFAVRKFGIAIAAMIPANATTKNTTTTMMTTTAALFPPRFVAGVSGTGVPHALQKRAPGARALPHRWQYMAWSDDISGSRSCACLRARSLARQQRLDVCRLRDLRRPRRRLDPGRVDGARLGVLPLEQRHELLQRLRAVVAVEVAQDSEQRRPSDLLLQRAEVEIADRIAPVGH